ncbi:isoleucine--tRNA ligase [Candidatus Uhrbacteria bacterium]|nr:isoleucine--tRNA ligase [Candidatus Uhrbacteria bacterium]
MSVSDREKKILEYWDKHQIFQKSVDQRPQTRPYVFYDGPPFATGLPHYGHIVASLMKDVVPRYRTMKGDRVERVWGWDCHGLPIENIIEERLQLSSKQDIEKFGIGKFNNACREAVLEYAEEWKKTIRRMGRWVDMEHAYKTMDISYMESVWWVFAQVWKQGLIYEGKKAMHVCPRCVTSLSNFEVTLGYKEITDISATVAFKLTNTQETFGVESLSILAWTTTPWTLPGNVLLAVGPEIEYVILSIAKDPEEDRDSLRSLGMTSKYIIAKDRLKAYQEDIKDLDFITEKTVKGKDLAGLSYEPLFPYFKDTSNAFRVVTADFVSTEEGTGVVHIAPAFGEDDYQLGVAENVGFVQHVSMDGTFTNEVTDFAGHEVKPKEDSSCTDIEIIKYLAKKKALFAKKKYVHSYPHCWRCDTPLLNYATSSWFVKVTALKEQLLANNEQISWVPQHMKEGRFGKWLESARDWAISRSRYWGAPLPIWKSEDGDVLCIESVAQLEEFSGQKIDDIHKDHIDSIVIEKDGKTYRRIPEVLDCWFESGSMPYAQMHYPFENKEKFEKGFPAEFIAEGQDQTRGWFYTLHVLAAALTSGDKPCLPVKRSLPAFRNCVVNGIVLAEDGKKMSKRLQNYPDPLDVLEKYGADALRFYLVSSPVMHAENMNFSEKHLRETYNKVVNTLWNVVVFYETFAGDDEQDTHSDNVLDQWIVSKLQRCIQDVTKHMELYELSESVRPLQEFITDLSQWYVRRSRERVKSDSDEERAQALSTLRMVLGTLARLMAPFTPFVAEEIYQRLQLTTYNFQLTTFKESVHLEMWPVANESLINQNIEEAMDQTRAIVEIAHALRAEGKIKVRHPLPELRCTAKLPQEFESIITDEVNVKKVSDAQALVFQDGWLSKEDGGVGVSLCVQVSDELKREGMARDFIRQVNALRKNEGLTIHDRVDVAYHTDSSELKSVLNSHEQSIKESILAKSFAESRVEGGTLITIGDAQVIIKMTKS